MAVRSITDLDSGKVLVINSDPEITRILEVNLVHANLEIVSARSGSEALSKIQSDKIDIIILDPALPDMGSAEIYRKITESSQANHVPVILISSRLPRKNRIASAEAVPTYYVTKPFDPKEVVALVQGYLMHKERMVHINPLTGLPNRLQISKEIDRLIAQKTTFTAIYIVLHDLKSINKAYGYAQGDRIVQLLADVVSEAVRLFGNTEDLAGYFGGDKFVIISTLWKARTLCRKIIADFNKRIRVLRDEEFLQMDQAGYERPSNSKDQSPVMSIHIAMVSSQKRAFQHSLEVTETALEQIEYLKRSPESNCYFDLKVGGIEPSLKISRKELMSVFKEGGETIQGVLEWFDFLLAELGTPMNVIKDSLHTLKTISAENLSQEHFDSLEALHTHYSQLNRVVEGIANLARCHDGSNGTCFDEVDVGRILGWVMEQLDELLVQKSIKADIEIVGDVGRITRDKKSLTQSLLYIVRSEIKLAPPESHLYIRLTEQNEEHVCIEINNPKHYRPSSEFNTLFEKQFKSTQHGIPVNELYPALVLVRGMGGELEATSARRKGTTYRVTLPKKWRSWMQELDTLQLAMEISRKEARDALKNINQNLSSLVEQVPLTIKDHFGKLSSKVQEMGVLCNRSLFLADDLSNRLESHQDRLLQHEVEQGVTLEALLTVCRGMTRSLRLENAFNLESAKRVANYALSIANKFKISEVDRQALRYAALFKDLGLVLSPNDMVKQMMVPSIEEAIAIKTHCDLVWKALSTISCLSPALELIQYKYERYDGKGRRLGARGDDIPLGARILAIADKFDQLTSDRSPQGKLTPKLAMQEIVEDSGLRFDPHIVGTFVLLWKRKELVFKVE